MNTDIIERLRATFADKPYLPSVCGEAADEIERLRGALKRVLADIAEYERINNLAPNPGRQYCWDSVAHAHDVLRKP